MLVWTVGYYCASMAAVYDQERRDKGLAYNEIDVGGGTIVDAKNTYSLLCFPSCRAYRKYELVMRKYHQSYYKRWVLN